MSKRYLNIEELMEYTGLSINMAKKLGREAGACRKYGKRIMYDRISIDNYMETLAVG